MKAGEIFVLRRDFGLSRKKTNFIVFLPMEWKAVFRVTLLTLDKNFGKKCVNMSNIKYDLFKYFVYYEVVEFTE